MRNAWDVLPVVRRQAELVAHDRVRLGHAQNGAGGTTVGTVGRGEKAQASDVARDERGVSRPHVEAEERVDGRDAP